MAIKEYTTAYSGANPVQDADPITGVMPDLTDESFPGAGDGDETRSSQVEFPRDKLQAACKMVGDSVNAPAGSLAEIIDRDHTNGDALQVRLRERAADPTNIANKGFIYTKDNGSGVTELFYVDSAGTVSQLSPAAKANLSATAAPVVGDDDADGYLPGSLWVDITNDKAYICLDATTGAAVWIEITQSGGGGGFTPYEEEFTAVAGSNVFTLSATPAVNANTLSGRNILGVFRNGVRSRYQAAPVGPNEFSQSGGVTKINVISQSGGEIFTVVFGV